MRLNRNEFFQPRCVVAIHLDYSHNTETVITSGRRTNSQQRGSGVDVVAICKANCDFGRILFHCARNVFIAADKGHAAQTDVNYFAHQGFARNAENANPAIRSLRRINPRILSFFKSDRCHSENKHQNDCIQFNLEMALMRRQWMIQIFFARPKPDNSVLPLLFCQA